MSGHWKRLIESAVAFRHDLHRKPELTWEEVGTAKRVRDVLTESGIRWRACTETGTVASFAPEAGGCHVALRADLDALPISEATGAAWASENPGCMHACGHDGHTATMVAFAGWLKQCEADLPGPVSVLFQPAEEGGHGAKRMIEEGALEGVDAIFGWHNWPAIPFGHAVCPDGPVLAANGTFGITLRGRGGHASQPEACRDPVLAAAAVTTALQQIAARRLPPQQAAVLSVTSIDARSADTIIPDEAVLGGSFRIADNALRSDIHALIREVVENTARGFGVEAEVELRPRYGATVNHPAEAERYREALAAEFGPGWRSEATPMPVMASEDFSYYLEHTPGAFALIGADDGEGHDEPCHSPRYDFNDRLIERVVRLSARLVGAPLPD